MPVPIDRRHPLLRTDPVISRLSDEEVRALTGLMARLAASIVRRRMAQERHDDPDPGSTPVREAAS